MSALRLGAHASAPLQNELFLLLWRHLVSFLLHSPRDMPPSRFDRGSLSQPAQAAKVVSQDGPGLGLREVEAEYFVQFGRGSAEGVVAAEQ